MRKLVIVFGGSRGIGKATVERLIREGYDVAYTATKSVMESAEHVRSYALDVRDEDAVASFFEAVQSDFGKKIHGVVVNAGINVPPKPLAEFPTEDFNQVFAVNVFGAFNVLRQAARHVEDAGSIIAMSTSLVRKPVPGAGPYIATKAALEALVRSMAIELAPRQVRVNMVAPGPVDTDLFRSGKNEEAVRRSAALSLFNRVGTPEEVANVIYFLLSPQSSWIEAQVVQPNGGLV